MPLLLKIIYKSSLVQRGLTFMALKRKKYAKEIRSPNYQDILQIWPLLSTTTVSLKPPSSSIISVGPELIFLLLRLPFKLF